MIDNKKNVFLHALKNRVFRIINKQFNKSNCNAYNSTISKKRKKKTDFTK